MDLTVLAVPGYFASMEAERRHLARKAEVEGPTAATYTREDAIASLAMGTGSLFIPLLIDKALRPVAPGRGRYGKVLVGAVLGAAAVTTIADVVARRAEGPLPEAGVLPPAGEPLDGRSPAAERPEVVSEEPSRARRRRVAKLARRVAGSTGAAAVASGIVAGSAAWIARTGAKRVFAGNDRDLGSGPLAVAGATLGWDFIYYWNHRLSHESRWLWAMHVVHHSSERYNLSTALRQPVAGPIAPAIQYGLLAHLGFRPSVIQTARGLNLLYQYWIHTEVIGKLGRFEEWFNTPSHHRVHHGSNRRYLDRNHGSILIIWDRLFGTFQRELDEEPVVYGLTKNIDTYNLARVATHEYVDILRDVAGSDNWADRISYALRGPGWAHERNAEKLLEAESRTSLETGSAESRSEVHEPIAGRPTELDRLDPPVGRADRAESAIA